MKQFENHKRGFQEYTIRENECSAPSLRKFTVTTVGPDHENEVEISVYVPNNADAEECIRLWIDCDFPGPEGDPGGESFDGDIVHEDIEYLRRLKTAINLFDDITVAAFRSGYQVVAEIANKMAHDTGFWAKDIGFGGKLALIHSELSEALEAIRDGGKEPDKHCPAFLNVEVELADAIIRIMDLGVERKLNIGGALIAKMKANAMREHLHGRKF